jgi:hypothetical protein
MPQEEPSWLPLAKRRDDGVEDAPHKRSLGQHVAWAFDFGPNLFLESG